MEINMRPRALLFTAGLLLTALPALAQKIDLRNDRVDMTVLNGPWRFHAGDDPAWANPNFDDSGWSLLRADKGWAQQGYSGTATAWYRINIALPPQSGQLAFYLPSVWVSCQVFANGRLIGQEGNLQPNPEWVTSTPMMFTIPDSLASSDELHLAVRVWQPEEFAKYLPGGLVAPPRIGNAAAIAQWQDLQLHRVFWENAASVVELIANLIGALASLGMFWLRRKEREYLWFGLYLLNWSAFHVVTLTAAFHPTPYLSAQLLKATANAVGVVISFEFFALLLKQPRGWAYKIGDAVVLIDFGVFLIARFQPAGPWGSIRGWGFLVINFCLLALIYRAWRSGSRDAGILMIPVVWGFGEAAITRFSALQVFPHPAWVHSLVQFINSGIQWPFPYYLPSLRGDVSNLMVLVILILRYARSRADEERLESELEAARTVQKVLIPSEFPVIPGFHVEAVYKPASQVGGDFFQIISVGNGSALVAVGDVSGKGMPAAMTVSLLVGTFRTLAHYTRKPGEILRAMNHRMLARSAGGFTTCVVLCVDPDGNVTAANAGHLAPYVAGRELVLEGGLPLGLDARTTYTESHFRLKPGDQLTLVTDGVPEARNTQGELFGFENTAAIANKSAEDIAETARKFGQNDDVTVVKLTWEPALLSPSAALVFSGEPTFS